MSKLTLYGVDASPPVRAVQMTLAALQVPYEYVQVNLGTGEHLKPEFLKKNPQHTVPVLEDGDAAISDSHAIICYLVSKYGENDSLYPKDLLKRAVVDQRLYFESGVVFANALRSITYPIIAKGLKVVSKERIQAIVEAYDFVETFLKDHDYIAGDSLTVADFSILTTITSLDIFKKIDAAKYVKLSAWIKRLEQLPYSNINTKGVADLAGLLSNFNYSVEE